MVIIRAIGWVRERLGIHDVAHKHINKPQRIADLIPELRSPLFNNIIILVNGKPATKDTVVNDNDEILLMPVTSGG